MQPAAVVSAVAAAAVLAVCLATGCAGRGAQPTSGSLREAPVVALAVGDIACQEAGCKQRETAALALRLVATRGVSAIFTLGDHQYVDGTLDEFLRDYDPTWGHPALKAITHPAAGNHDYAEYKSDAGPYFDYFNGPDAASGPAGERGKGWYSLDLGAWHVVALNTGMACREPVPCGPGSPQHRWLVEDLARNRKRCVLAYWHDPRFQNGTTNGEAAFAAPLWDALVDAGAELALTGHEHNFQALAPLDKAGRRDDARGMRSFVVGTGGHRDLYAKFGAARADAVEAKTGERWGVLELTLGVGSYEWRFVAVGGSPDGDVLFSGKGTCR